MLPVRRKVGGTSVSFHGVCRRAASANVGSSARDRSPATVASPAMRTMAPTITAPASPRSNRRPAASCRETTKRPPKKRDDALEDSRSTVTGIWDRQRRGRARSHRVDTVHTRAVSFARPLVLDLIEGACIAAVNRRWRAMVCPSRTVHF